MKALVSYNKLNIPESLKTNIACFEYIFNPKHPNSVVKDDRVYQELLKHQHKFSEIIIFLGKKSSGSCEILKRVWKDMDQLKLFFILCDHDLKEKTELLHKLKVPFKQYMSFCDNRYLEGKRCDEVSVMLGMALQKAD